MLNYLNNLLEKHLERLNEEKHLSEIEKIELADKYKFDFDHQEMITKTAQKIVIIRKIIKDLKLGKNNSFILEKLKNYLLLLSQNIYSSCITKESFNKIRVNAMYDLLCVLEHKFGKQENRFSMLY